MSSYTFVFKKDDIKLEFQSDDKSAIEKQMQIWVTCASVYAHNSQPPKVSEQIKQAFESKNAIEASQPVEAETASAPEQSAESEQSAEPKQSAEPEQTAEPEKVSTTPKTVESENIPQKETYFATIDDIKKESPKENELTINTLHKPIVEKSFEELLEKSIEENSFEPKYRHDDKFINFVNSINIEDADIKLSLLLKTAHYLSHNEYYERVTLKAMNAKLMQNFSTIIDHSIIQTAIDKGYLELIPDLTGMADAAEYSLTDYAEKLFS